MDIASTIISTKSPIIQISSQRIICCTAASLTNHKPYILDMPQAYIQSRSNPERVIYLQAPEEMGLAHDECLLVLKPLYGIPESGLHWFLTFQNHHIEKLVMAATTVDPCLLSKREGKSIDGIATIQVDDTFGHGTEEFLNQENSKTKSTFKTKPRKIFQPGESVTFNGTNILFEKDKTFKLSQK